MWLFNERLPDVIEVNYTPPFYAASKQKTENIELISD